MKIACPLTYDKFWLVNLRHEQLQARPLDSHICQGIV